ncbi:MAG TPA: hypothetical protein VGF93_04205 [Solirubrobacteraceae bacterium]|jgi:hypothetical protein
MSLREREGLIARIRQVRRTESEPSRPSAAPPPQTPDDELGDLEARIAHLEQLVEGLQDSVHRESARQGQLIDELEARTQPAAISAALSKDARDRGI